MCPSFFWSLFGSTHHTESTENTRHTQGDIQTDKRGVSPLGNHALRYNIHVIMNINRQARTGTCGVRVSKKISRQARTDTTHGVTSRQTNEQGVSISGKDAHVRTHNHV